MQAGVGGDDGVVGQRLAQCGEQLLGRSTGQGRLREWRGRLAEPPAQVSDGLLGPRASGVPGGDLLRDGSEERARVGDELERRRVRRPHRGRRGIDPHQRLRRQAQAETAAPVVRQLAADAEHEVRVAEELVEHGR